MTTPNLTCEQSQTLTLWFVLEQVPLDGDIVYGEAQVSMQHITGEAMPSRLAKGASVPAGSQNHDGILVVRHHHSKYFLCRGRLVVDV